MKKDDSILSNRAQKAVTEVKNYFKRRPVGGQIYDYQLWEDFKQRCIDYKVLMTPEGMEHMLRLANKIDEVLFPIARASGLVPIMFTEERIDKLLEVIKNNKEWITETNRLHDIIINKTDKNLTLQGKGK